MSPYPCVLHVFIKSPHPKCVPVICIFVPNMAPCPPNPMSPISLCPLMWPCSHISHVTPCHYCVPVSPSCPSVPHNPVCPCFPCTFMSPVCSVHVPHALVCPRAPTCLTMFLCFPHLHHMSPCHNSFPLCPLCSTMFFYPQRVPCVSVSPVCSRHVHCVPSMSLCPQPVLVSSRSPHPLVSHVSVCHHSVPHVPLKSLCVPIASSSSCSQRIPILSLYPCCIPWVPIMPLMCPVSLQPT